ncbi:hypothetical protein Micbo1qcDRAFT_161075 [Microdochium bolleyi]|uniref:Inner membrane assembly complex subunit 17 n=1 Tax=Microdochium bolleyi TaxID=196109 RepID=A0A136J7M4_9PEZI|nr:hypothetical protein Micbo1qcDRAFT_161075 [Microdochium bolleyi]
MSRLLQSTCGRAAARRISTAAAVRQPSTIPRSLAMTLSTRTPSPTSSTTTTRCARRMYSSEQQPKSKSPSSEFYKTFGRPIAKVFLLAIFTYQVAYYFWVRLEQDEMKRDMEATIAELEARISELEVAGQKK